MEPITDQPPRADDARDTCANCGAHLRGPWCHGCGQRDLGTRVELKELLGEVVRETFELEGALPRTLASIAVRPGHYLGEVLDGRRRSYASPFRFYLFMLFLFAVAMSWWGDGVARQISELRLDASTTTTQKTEISGFTLRVETEGDDDGRASLDAPDAVFARLLGEQEPASGAGGPADLASLVWYDELACVPPPAGAGARLTEILAEERSAGQVFQVVVKAVLQQVPIVFSLVVVGHVLILQLLWWREPLSTHVVTSLVLHDLLLVALSLWALWPGPLLALLLFLWVQAHVVMGLKRAYRSPWPRTLLAFALSAVGWAVGSLGGFGLAAWLAMRELVQTYVP